MKKWMEERMKRLKDKKEGECSGRIERHLVGCTLKNVNNVWKKIKRLSSQLENVALLFIYLSANFYSPLKLSEFYL